MIPTRAALAAVLLIAIPVAPAAAAPQGDPAPPTSQEQMAGLQAMCAETAADREARHAATPLYERLGGEARVQALTSEIVRLHHVNEDIRHYFEGVDSDRLALLVAQFVAAGTGGPQAYEGRDLHSLHAGMKLSDADFLSAGGDVVQAMQNLEYGQDEIDEMVCILVSLKDQVVLE
jgi:hemoglobin